MRNKLDDATWIFVVVQDPSGKEQFLGLHDEKTDISYIPAFHNRDDAISCLIHLPAQKGIKYEVQAIMYGDLSRDALENNFSIFLLDGDGKIIDKIFPDQASKKTH